LTDLSPFRSWTYRGARALICLLWMMAAPGRAFAQLPAEPPPRPIAAPGLLPEPAWLTRGIDVVLDKFTASGAPPSGLYPTFATRMPGSGWIAIGPGYRTHLWNDRLFADVSGAVSWRRFLSSDARLELSHLAHDRLTIGAQSLAQDWTQIEFFGVGPNSTRSRRSQFRLRAVDLSAYGMVRTRPGVDVRARIGLLGRARIDPAAGWHMRPLPNSQDAFTDPEAPALGGGPRLWHADVVITGDSLDHPGHPTRGGLVQAAASVFHDTDTGAYSFRRFEFVALGMVPVIPDRWTLAVRGTVITSTPARGHRVPFYLMPSLGGQSLLRGFDSNRFRDADLMAINIESRWALLAHMDVALFVDTGQVAPRLGAFRRADLQAAVGGGLRIHTGVATIVRLDVAHGGEGWHMAFKLSESLSLSTIRRWASVIPIVP
jgi:hypothetical protein